MTFDDSTIYTLGPYQLVKLIGEVRTSRLYLARHEPDHQTVALRAITHPRAAEPEFQAAFLETMQRIAAMQEIDGLPHPHIVPVLHFAVEEGIPYFATPHFEKGALSTWLAEHAPVNAQVALDIAAQVADALDHAHACGMAHGDVRPANMLIADDSSIHLTGFGLADLFAEPVQVRDRTVTLIGSQYYMSPDVALAGQSTPGGDVYALGVTLYEMLAGKRPFAEETPLKTLWAHARTPLPSLAEQRPDLPSDAVHWIEQALAKRPEDRTATAGDLVRWAQAAITAAVEDTAANPHTKLLKGVKKRRGKERPEPEPPAPAEPESLLPVYLAVAGVTTAMLALLAVLFLGARALLQSAALSSTATRSTSGYAIGIPTDIPGVRSTLDQPPSYAWPTLVPTPTPRPSYTPWPTYTPRSPVPPTPTWTPSPTARSSSGSGGGAATQPPGPPPAPGAVFTVGVIYPQTPDAPPSPSGNAIVFVRDGQLYAVSADGSDLMQLTSHAGRHVRPSRSGGLIAFYSDRDGNLEIYVIAANGTNPARVTTDPASDTDPSWSWPGDVLAFSSMRSGGGDIYTMRGDGAGLAQVTSDPAQDRWPSWFPFGGRLVFASNRDGGDFDLFAQNADGSALAQLTRNGVDDTTPVWSPDGGRIAYLSGGNVYVINNDGGGQRQLTSSGGVQAVSWSPDGAALVYSRGGDLYVIRAEGGSPVRITSGGAADTDPSWAR